MDHGSLQEHTKTDRALFTLPASPSQALHNKRHIHGQKPYIFSLYVQSLEIIFIKHVRLVVFEGKNVNQMAAVLLRVDSDSPKSHRVSNKQTDQGSSRPATPVLNWYCLLECTDLIGWEPSCEIIYAQNYTSHLWVSFACNQWCKGWRSSLYKCSDQMKWLCGQMSGQYLFFLSSQKCVLCHPNYFRLTAALPWVLSDAPVKCDVVKKMEWNTDRQRFLPFQVDINDIRYMHRGNLWS